MMHRFWIKIFRTFFIISEIMFFDYNPINESIYVEVVYDQNDPKNILHIKIHSVNFHGYPKP